MSTAVLDWKMAMDEGNENRESYVTRLQDFIDSEHDAPDRVRALLKNGKDEEARTAVHTVRGKAKSLGAKAVAGCALELEMTIKAGADAEHALCRFADMHMDTLLTMRAFMA